MPQRQALVGVGDLGVGAGDQRDQVGGDPLGGLEVHQLRSVPARLDGAAAGVGDDLPVEGRGDVHREGGLEVGLVEAGEHPLGLGRLEVRVEVDRVVLGVDEAVQALAGAGVPALGVDHELVGRGQAGQRQPALLGVPGDVQRGAVQGGRVHPCGDQVDERVAARGRRVEADRRGRPERLDAGVAGAVGDVELEVVLVHGEELGARGGGVAGQVGNSHTGQLPTSVGPARVGG